MRKFSFLIVFLFGFLSIVAQKTEKPTLVVGIVIDQMRYDILARYWDKFGDNGFKKIVDGGTFCKNAHYEYLNVNSASGYATIACGSYPSQHGIINMKWYDRLLRTEVYCVDDNSVNSVGSVFGEGRSPKNLSSTSWTDELRVSTYKMSKVYSVGMNDYASVISGGKLANTAFWFDENTGKWVTSSYYIDSLKEWTNDFNEKMFADIYLQRSWTTTFPILKYTESLSDATAYEIGIAGQRTFPYDLAVLKNKYNNYDILNYTPFANTFTKDFAINLMMNEYLGKDPYTDVLLINFAATGYIGDLFGIQSVEFEDAFIKLDKDIAHLISSIEDYVGMENVVIYLTSDRGACENTQWLTDINIETGEFNYKRTSVVLNSYLRAIYGMGNWIDGFYNDEIYLSHFDIDKASLTVVEMQERSAQMFVNFKGTATAIPTLSLLRGTYSSGIMKQAQNSYFQARSGDVFLVLDYGWRFQDDGTSLCDCNSGYNENTHVPLIFYGGNVPKKDIYRKVSMDDLAVTLSFLLDISLPNKSTGNPVVEVLE
ncbi:MAG: alkaline phosphatase family protein [Bacteroidales bacterium]|nr:alkaline phosphatase family protein [Bacteroidales bacterium]